MKAIDIVILSLFVIGVFLFLPKLMLNMNLSAAAANAQARAAQGNSAAGIIGAATGAFTSVATAIGDGELS